MSPSAMDKLKDYTRSAAQIFMVDGTRQKYAAHGMNVFKAATAPPVLPTTQAVATPHVLLLGPFKDEPGLAAVGVYLGIGFIEVRDLSDVRVHQIVLFDGDHVEARRAYLAAALHLYFDVKKVETPAS